MLILDSIQEYVRPIEQRVRDGDVFGREMSREGVRRAFAEHVLQPMLPPRYSVRIGRAFSVDDALSHAESILITDAHHALPLGRLTPCETVYAMCEVAPVLDRDHFEACVLNVASLKALHRVKATAHDLSPSQHLSLFGARYAQLSDDKVNRYLGYVFANRGDDGHALMNALNTLVEERSLQPEESPDAIFCLSDGWLISRQSRTGDASVPRSSFAKFGLWHPGEHTLALVYVLLNLSLSQIQLRGADLLRPLAALTRGGDQRKG
jgi:hypothetical protein